MGISTTLLGIIAHRGAISTVPNISVFTRVNPDGSGVANNNDVCGFVYASGNSSRMALGDVRQPGNVRWVVLTSDAFQTQTDRAAFPIGIGGNPILPLWMSADGQTIYARSETPLEPTYKSIDGGATWSSFYPWCILHVSNDGQKMFALKNGTLSATVYSTDGGSNWIDTTGEAPSFDFGSQGYVSCSNNGTYILMNSQASDNIYRSTDSGATFSLYATGANFHIVKIDNTGTLWRIATLGGEIFKYNGASWLSVFNTGLSQTASSNIREIDSGAGCSLVMSPDAKVIVTRNHISSDFGATFTSIAALVPDVAAFSECRMAVSDDGLKIALQAKSSGGGTDDAIYVNR